MADKRKRGGGLLGWLRSMVPALIIVILLRVFLLDTYFIESGSMKNTLLVGDYLAVNKLAMGPRIPFTDFRLPAYSEPRRNDVLVFDPHHEENMTIVKRVVGMPGDTLEMRDQILYVDGVRQDEPHVIQIGTPDNAQPAMLWQNRHLVGGPREDYRPTRDNWGPIVVPDDHYFMMGDNREDSLDSRVWGFLAGWRFKGRVSFIYFSYDRESHRAFPAFTEVRGSRIGDRVR